MTMNEQQINWSVCLVFVAHWIEQLTPDQD